MSSLKEVNNLYQNLTNEFSHTVIGYKEPMRLILAGLLVKGHILLEGVPGIAKALAKALNLTEKKDYQRIQCTPDLMPADLVGTLIYDPKKGEFTPYFGPIFAHFLLVDEINRAVPRTQSALLQGMQEREVTIGSETHKLDEPFFVVATQNPIEQEGTYPLPEAQLDRFVMKVKMGYPETLEEEVGILDLHEKRVTEPVEQFRTILKDPHEVCDMQRFIAEEVKVPTLIKHYIAEIIRYSRVREEVSWGSSPRAGIFLMKTAQGYAALSGRNIVQVEDVDAVAYAVLNHRIILKAEKVIEGIPTEQVIGNVLDIAKKTVRKSV
jgi:MoxR-like ATPase